MAQQYFPSWLSPRAFLVAFLLSASLEYEPAERTAFSIEGIVGWIVAAVVGGVFGGALFTWAIKKIVNKQ